MFRCCDSFAHFIHAISRIASITNSPISLAFACHWCLCNGLQNRSCCLFSGTPQIRHTSLGLGATSRTAALHLARSLLRLFGLGT